VNVFLSLSSTTNKLHETFISILNYTFFSQTEKKALNIGHLMACFGLAIVCMLRATVEMSTDLTQTKMHLSPKTI